jgi:hypothetical protein
VGRIRTAKELNKLTVQLQLLQEAAAAAGVDAGALTQASTSKGTVVPSYPLKPLGTLQSCFTTRCVQGPGLAQRQRCSAGAAAAAA